MKQQTQITGRMGELVIELELLKRGWLAVNTNAGISNFLGWDMLAIKNNRTVKIRVKAKRKGQKTFRWSAKKDGTILPELFEDDENDFTMAVSFDESEKGYCIYIIPSQLVERNIAEDHAEWLSGRKKDGNPRKDSAIRVAYMDNRIDKISHGYAQKWQNYLENWALLEQT